MRFMYLLLGVSLTLCCAAPTRVQAQGAGQPSAPASSPATLSPTTLSPAQAQAVLDVLQDDKKRAQFVAVLQGMIRAAPAAARHSAMPLAANSVGAELLVQGETWATRSAAQLRGAIVSAAGLPQLWSWLSDTVRNPTTLADLGATLWKLALILAGALAAEWITQRLLASTRRILGARMPVDHAADPPEPAAPDAERAEEELSNHRRRLGVAWRLLRRLPFALFALLIDLIPVVVFAAIGNVTLALPLEFTGNDRLVIGAVIDAYVACRLILCLTRAIVAPTHHGLRLVRCSDATAAYIMRWVRRVSTVAVAGYAVAEVALLFGLSDTAHDELIKLVALIVHIMLMVIVLQVRHQVANRLRARRNATGPIARLQNHMAQRWHTVAIFYIVALWLVAAAEIRDGYTRLLHFFIVTTAALLLARLFGIVVLGSLDRSLGADSLGTDTLGTDAFSPYRVTAGQRSVMQQRITRYYPMIRATLVSLITAATGVVLLEAWGFNPLTWFSVGHMCGPHLSRLENYI